MNDRREPGGSTEATADVYARISDAVFALDEEWRFTFLNEQAERVLRREEEDLLGTVIWDAFPEAVGTAFQREYERAMETQETVTFEEYYPPLDTWFEVRAYPSESGLSVYFHDITQRVERENQLQARERALRRAYEVIADPDLSLSDRINALLGVVREAIGTDYATLSRVDGDAYTFEAIDAPAGADLHAGDTIPLAATNCERVVTTERTLVLNDVDADAPDLAGRSGNAEWGISCYLGAPVSVDGEVYGTFCFYDMEARTEEFTDWEVTFVELLSNWVSHELERERYTARLAALNELNGIVHEITDAVIGRSTREEIESIACERLADTDSYCFAWIGEADPAAERVRLRTEAGVEGYLDGDGIPLDPDEEPPEPIARALRTGEMRTARHLGVDPDDESAPESAAECEYRSMAAVPIEHADSVYGVLNVYSERPDAFESEEGAVVEHLGEILGHAIAAAERKRALTSETVIELEFRIRDAFADDDPHSIGGSVAYDEIIPVGDGAFLLYGTAPDDILTSMEAVCDREPRWEDLVRLGERSDGVDFELRLSDPPLLATVASLGAAIERIVVDGGDYQMTVRLSPETDVGRVLDSVRDVYPDAQVVSKRRVTRSDDPSLRIERVITNDLTERQLTILRTAYHSGFFAWPREMSGTEVAESLDIASATFHQHLRAAQNKLFDALFDDGAAT